MRPEIGRFYRHYKGGLYMVIEIAVHTERDEELVIYRHVSGSVHARPIVDWMEPVRGSLETMFGVVPMPDQPRFKLVAA